MMKSFITVLIFIVLGLSHVFAACGTDCKNAVKDSNLFTAGDGYGSWGLAYYRDSAQAPIQTAHSAKITNAIIVIHGNTRDAFNYFCYTSYAVEAVGEKDNTYIVAPHFMMPSDNPQANAFYWVNNAGWKEGGRSHQNTTRISSFAMMDDLVKAFYNKDWFPGVKDVLIVGHSAGGQTVQRYAVATGIDASYNVRYVVANPGTYTYLNTFRAVLPNITTPTCTACVGEDILQTKYQFAIVSRATQQSCPEYNNWKMGIDSGNQYLLLRSATEIRAQYGKKNVNYILSTSDTCNNDLGTCGCNDNSLDTGCDALLLGYCRLMRGVAYYQYLQFYYKGNTTNPIHQLSYIDGLGHDGCLVINSNVTLKAMFNKGPVAITTTGDSTPSSTTGESIPSTSGSGSVTEAPSVNTPSPTNAPTSVPPTSASTSVPTNEPPTIAPKVITEVKAILTMSGNAADCDPAPIRASIASDLNVDVNAVTVTVTTTTAKRAVSATFYLDVRVKYTNVAAADTSSLQSQVTATVQSEAVKSVMASQGVTVTDVAVTSQSTPVETAPSSSSFVFPSLIVVAFSAFMLL